MLQKIRRMLKKEEGFTLVELMIVVVILGIISGIGIQQYGVVQKRARDTAHEANLRIIKGAAQMWLMTASDAQVAEFTNINQLVPDYLEAVPENPTTGEKDYTVEISGTYDTGYTITVGPDDSDEGGTETP